ncbi:MAG TPA: hypothetical protein VGM06_01365 [Polyangiaceae bacterium]|jgi:hypothetical protein
MTAFTTVTPTPTPLDSSKHVNYTLGMVLGVDDFGQEFAYHSARDKWLARDLLGSGTVRGLNVVLQPSSGPPTSATEIVVQPGVALTPHGQIVRVPTAQCAILGDWLANNQTTVATGVQFGSPLSPPTEGPGRGTLTLYVVLRYKESLTDNVPIPGEPCRSSDAAMAPSRVTDGFRLDFTPTPPAPTEELAFRVILDWLAEVPITQGLGSGPAALVAAMQAAFGFNASSPPSPSSFVPLPPPPGLSIGSTTAAASYRAALQLYATTLRDLLAASMGVAGEHVESGVLLATVQVPVAQALLGGAWGVDSTSAIVVDTGRPFLVPLDLLKGAWLASAMSHSRYRPVAAGIVAVLATVQSPPSPPPTSGMYAVWSDTGEVTVTLADNPAPGTHYVIKALPYVVSSPISSTPSVNLVVTSISTSPPGFTLAVFTGTTLATVANLQLLIEVTAVSGSWQTGDLP